MKTRYIITISEDEEPMWICKEFQPGTLTVLITARTWAEAICLFWQRKARGKAVAV